MANLIRTTVVWSGAPGLPGYSQFYAEQTGDIAAQAQSCHDNVRAMFSTLQTLIPEEITITSDPVFQRIDSATGALVSEDTVGTPAGAFEGTYVGGWNAQVGVLVEWITATVVNRRHLKGRTYLVPLGNVSDADGTLPDATLATVRAAIVEISESGSDFVVWHRPVSNAGGSIGAISGAVVRDHAAVLRSRMI